MSFLSRSIFGLIVFSLCTSCEPNKPLIDKKSTVRISSETEPHSFDPRQVRDLSDTTFIQACYEGLMRSEAGGKLTPAMAENYTLSPDKKIYTFYLRKSEWSDGQPVTAYDFYETWKTILDPEFPAPNAYQLYVIKGAKEAKEGKIPFEEVGIKALNDWTLEVELNHPTPYFLELTATYFCYPVSRHLRNDPKTTNLITNGPFLLHSNTALSTDEWHLEPNPYYWDRENVKLDQIKILKLDNSTALKLFDQKELEWAGSPLSTIPIDTLAVLKKKGNLNIQPASGVYFLRLNTAEAPFNNPKIRKAFALALNRTDLVEHALQGNQIAARGFVPPPLLEMKPLYEDNDLKTAKALFKEGLKEQNSSASSLPPISVCYSSNPRGHKIAQVIQQQWKEAFGVNVDLQSCESKVFYDRLKNSNYYIGIGSWFADVQDPLSFLDVFKYKNNGTNNTQWENPRYIELLDLSAKAPNSKERKALLRQAEEVLIAEMPIIPLFYSTYNYLQDPQLKSVYFSELGYLDLKKAYFEKS